MPEYVVTIGGSEYTISSPRELTDAEVTRLAQAQHYTPGAMLKAVGKTLTRPITGLPERAAQAVERAAPSVQARYLAERGGAEYLPGEIPLMSPGALAGALRIAPDTPLELALSALPFLRSLRTAASALPPSRLTPGVRPPAAPLTPTTPAPRAASAVQAPRRFVPPPPPLPTTGVERRMRDLGAPAGVAERRLAPTVSDARYQELLGKFGGQKGVRPELPPLAGQRGLGELTQERSMKYVPEGGPSPFGPRTPRPISRKEEFALKDLLEERLERHELPGIRITRLKVPPEELELGVPARLNAQLGEMAGQFRTKLFDPKGGAALRVLGGITGAAVGAPAGAAVSERTESDPLLGAALGALLGGTIGVAPSRVGRTLADFQRGMLLTGPAVLKAGLGAAGGLTGELAERALTQSPLRTARQVGQVVGSIPSGLARAGRALAGSPDVTLQAQRHLAKPGLFSTPAIRTMSALDAPARQALERIGLTREEALTAVLSGTPKTPLGQDVISFLGKHPAVKAAVAPVGALTSTNVLEQGLQRLPYGASFVTNRLVPSLRQSAGQTAARGLLGTTAFEAGYAAEPRTEGDYLTRGLLTALAGKYALPFALGIGVSAAEDPLEGVLQALQREAPIRLGQALTRENLQRRLVPAFAR